MLRSPTWSGGFLSSVIQGLFIVRPRGGVIKVLVHALVIVKLHPVADVFTQFSHAVVAVESDLFIFQATPKTLDKEIIHPPTFAIHTDQNIIFLQLADPILSGELTPFR